MLIRVITALMLAPVFIFLTLKLPSRYFAGLLAFILIMALQEWNSLDRKSIGLFLLSAIVMLGLCYWVFYVNPIFWVVCCIGSVFWLLQAFELFRQGAKSSFLGSGSTILGAIILFACWCGLVFMHQQGEKGPWIALSILFVVWFADSCAYFAGKFLGKRKLAPHISPNKTVEGFLGGVLGATIVAILLGFSVMGLTWLEKSFVIWLTASIASALVSVVGDLYQSRMKRLAGVKDSGSLLPGHGGVLDRIDGLIAASPVFAAIWWLVI